MSSGFSNSYDFSSDMLPQMQVELLIERGQLHNPNSLPDRKILVPRDVEILIGRGESCDLRFHAEQELLVSTNHCIVKLQGGAVWLIERRATNGTYIDGSRVQEQQQLRHGQRIVLGSIVEPESREGPSLLVQIVRAASVPATIQVSRIPVLVDPQTLRMAPSSPQPSAAQPSPSQPVARSAIHEQPTLVSPIARPAVAPPAPIPPSGSAAEPPVVSPPARSAMEKSALSPSQAVMVPAGSSVPTPAERDSALLLKRQAFVVLGILLGGCVLGLLIGTL